MKKFSMNLLKVGLLSILGLCMIGITSEVKAATKVLNLNVETNVVKLGKGDKDETKRNMVYRSNGT